MGLSPAPQPALRCSRSSILSHNESTAPSSLSRTRLLRSLTYFHQSAFSSMLHPRCYHGAVRFLQHVHFRFVVDGLRRPALILRSRRAGELPVLVHIVAQRARVLRLRRTEQPLANNVAAVLPPPTGNGVGISLARPLVRLSTLLGTSQDARPTYGSEKRSARPSMPCRQDSHDEEEIPCGTARNRDCTWT